MFKHPMEMVHNYGNGYRDWLFYQNVFPLGRGGNSTLIRRVCATGVLNLSPCSGVGKPKKDTLLWSYRSFLKSIVSYGIVSYHIVSYHIALETKIMLCFTY